MATEQQRPMAAEVQAWFDESDNPLLPVLRAVRDVIVEDPDISECIKYRASAFTADGIVCYFNGSAKKRASLTFPSGGTIPGEHPCLVDGSNLQRMMYFVALADVHAKADDLRAVIDACMVSRD